MSQTVSRQNVKMLVTIILLRTLASVASSVCLSSRSIQCAELSDRHKTQDSNIGGHEAPNIAIRYGSTSFKVLCLSIYFSYHCLPPAVHINGLAARARVSQESLSALSPSAAFLRRGPPSRQEQAAVCLAQAPPPSSQRGPRRTTALAAAAAGAPARAADSSCHTTNKGRTSQACPTTPARRGRACP